MSNKRYFPTQSGQMYRMIGTSLIGQYIVGSFQFVDGSQCERIPADFDEERFGKVQVVDAEHGIKHPWKRTWHDDGQPISQLRAHANSAYIKTLLLLIMATLVWGCSPKPTGEESNAQFYDYMAKKHAFEALIDETDLPGTFEVFFESYTDTTIFELYYSVEEGDRFYTYSVITESTQPDTLVQPLAGELLQAHECRQRQ